MPLHSVKNLMRNKRLFCSIAEASWGEFPRQLVYKCAWQGKYLLNIGRFDASSQRCSGCAWKKEDLTLSEREWVCLSCGVLHDRDINAARHIVRFAFAKCREDRDLKPVDNVASVLCLARNKSVERSRKPFLREGESHVL